MTDSILKWRDPIQSVFTRSRTPQLNHAIPVSNACRSVIAFSGQWSANAPQQCSLVESRYQEFSDWTLLNRGAQFASLWFYADLALEYFNFNEPLLGAAIAVN